MNKALLLSVRPEHTYNILTGNKTLELRKSVPKGFKGWVYVYVTKGQRLSVVHDDENGETYYYLNSSWGRELNGTIPFRFWFDEWEEVLTQHHIDSEQIERILKQACIEPEDLDKYVGDKETIYAWHIKQLDIFYEPMKLSEFYKDYDKMDTDSNGKDVGWYEIGINPITKAPQSYMYVWVKEEK